MIHVHPRTGEARMSLATFSALEFAGACKMAGVEVGGYKPTPREKPKTRRRRRKPKA